jgi:transglutaminase-like putative cysteine protease
MTLNRRMTVTAAVAVVLTSTVLYPIFTDSLWFAASMGAVLVVAAVGALTRLRTLPVVVCVAAGLVGLLLYLNLVFEAGHSWAGVIPTPTSIARLWDLVGTGLNDSRTYAPPVPNLPGLLFLTEAGVGIAALATDLIAVRLRSTALAGLPLLVLFTVPVMINAPHSQVANPLVFCLAGAGYLAMLSADGRERIRVWGRLISLWRTGPAPDAEPRATLNGPGFNGSGLNGSGLNGSGLNGSSLNGSSMNGSSMNGSSLDRSGVGGMKVSGGRLRGPDTRVLAAAGRRVGLASIVLALCAPLLVPGLHPSKLFSSGPGIGGTGGGTGSLSLPSTLSQTIRDLQEKHPSVVFTYTTSATARAESDDAQYFRQYVSDTLSDDPANLGWQVSNYGAGAQPLVLMPGPQGLASTVAPPAVKTTVTMTKGFSGPNGQPTFLPLVYPPIQLDVKGKWLADPDLMVYSGDNSIAGQSYTETSLNVDPSTAQLQRLGKLTNTAGLTADLQLPASYKTPALENLAKTYANGEKTEIGEVDALAAWLSSNQFSYNLNAPAFATASGLLTFLTKTRSGVCVQSAYAMTVLTRLLGIPARFVLGYTAGSQVKGNEYKVMNTDAHAWTEVWFPTFGWLRFEPTTGGQGTAHATNYMANAAGASINSGVPIDSATAASGAQGPAKNNNAVGSKFRQTGGITGPGEILSGNSAGTPWAAIALAVIAAIALACGIIAMVAPPARRAMAVSASPGTPGRRRRPVSATSVALVTVAAALIALALYRLLSRTSGLHLSSGWATVGIAFGAAAAVALIAPSTIRPLLRRWRWMRADDDASRAHIAWREFRDDLTDYGVGCRASEPPRTLAGRVTAGVPEPAGDAIRRLALAEERATYAARPSGSENLRRDGSTAREGLAASAGRGARWRARLFPASLVNAFVDATAAISESLTTRLSRRHAQQGSAR